MEDQITEYQRMIGLYDNEFIPQAHDAFSKQQRELRRSHYQQAIDRMRLEGRKYVLLTTGVVEGDELWPAPH